MGRPSEERSREERSRTRTQGRGHEWCASRNTPHGQVIVQKTFRFLLYTLYFVLYTSDRPKDLPCCDHGVTMICCLYAASPVVVALKSLLRLKGRALPRLLYVGKHPPSTVGHDIQVSGARTCTNEQLLAGLPGRAGGQTHAAGAGVGWGGVRDGQVIAWLVRRLGAEAWRRGRRGRMAPWAEG